MPCRVAAMPGTGRRSSSRSVEIDRLDGGIGRLVERKRRLTPDEATTIADESLDDYINALLRRSGISRPAASSRAGSTRPNRFRHC